MPNPNRRLPHRPAIIILLSLLAIAPARGDEKKNVPNIIVILADDQGFGDLGFHGNPKIRTPNLDHLAKQSVELRNFYVCPVCSPTRSSLMTGRWNYRTGVVDTFVGRSMMRPDEVTLAQMLAKAGYRTGIFGKWHLGDNYPLRAMDRGFHESLVLRGGGIGQSSDPPGGSSYFDPLLSKNGQLTATKGYCSDVYTDAALAFIEKNRAQPFFVYLPFNAPHTPLQVPEQNLKVYQQMDLALSAFPNPGHAVQGKYSTDTTARVYGMVENIDANIGRLRARLDALKLTQNTIVIFFTDNGPQQPRYNAGLHGLKGSVYDGGIHVACLVSWPGQIPAGGKVDGLAAHIDLAPTLLDACGAAAPAKVAFDGRSLLPILRDPRAAWPERTLFFQWHRGDVPEKFRACAVRTPRWKLVQAQGLQSGKPLTPRFELFDMNADPFEMKDLAGDHPEIVADLKRRYELWFGDVTRRGFEPPRIILGSEHENPSALTRQDWRGPRSTAPKPLGHWEVQIARAGSYRVTLNFPAAKEAKAYFRLGQVALEKPLAAGATECVFDLKLEPGPARLEAWLGEDKLGVHHVDVRRLE